jgi:tryptophan synthase alpha chain
VTGARETLPKDIELFVNRVRKVSTLPLCLGFGISTPQQAVQVANIADGVIIGSRIIQHMEKDDEYISLSGFIKEIKDAIDSQSSYQNS